MPNTNTNSRYIIQDYVIGIFAILLILISYIYVAIRFTIGFLIVLPILTIISSLTRFKYTNCWVYVAKQYLTKGGYIIFRRTNWNKYKWLNWEHAYWTPDCKVYYDMQPLNIKHKRILPPLLFKGKVTKIYDINQLSIII